MAVEEEKPKEGLEALEKEKSELLERLKEADRRYRYKMYEAKALGEMLEKRRKESIVPPAREIRKRLRRLEFIISTEARTLKQERELVKEVREWERKLKSAVEIERMERRLVLISDDIKGAEGQIAELERRMDEMRKTIRERRSADSKFRKDRKLVELKKRVEEERHKDAEPFTQKEGDGRVGLGEICIIKKKEK